MVLEGAIREKKKLFTLNLWHTDHHQPNHYFSSQFHHITFSMCTHNFMKNGHKIAFQIHENKYATVDVESDITNAIHTVSIVCLCAAKIPFFAKLQAKVSI